MLDNALMHQKDSIIDKIDNGTYEEAILLLSFAKEVWASCTYGYKWRELQLRLLETIARQQEQCTHWKSIQKLQATAQKVLAI